MTVRPMSVPAEPGKSWAAWLVLLIVAIAVSPRVRFGAGGDGKAFDIRIQDALLLPTLVALVLSRHVRPQMWRVWGPWAIVVISLSSVVALVGALIQSEIVPLRAAAFHGRFIELFLLAVAIAGCYVAAGRYARGAAVLALNISVWLNLGWILFQYFSGESRVFIGSLGNQIESYGPKLIGEPSAFGTGFFCVSAIAWGASRVFFGERRGAALVMVLTASAAVYLTQSRVSMVAAAIIVAVLIVRPSARTGVNVAGVLLAGAVVVVTVQFVPTVAEGRLSAGGLETSANARVDGIWAPLLEVMLAHPLFGIGPGALGTDSYPWTEAHNILLRVSLDYGIIVAAAYGVFLLTMFVRAGRSRFRREQGAIFAAYAQALIGSVMVAGLVQESMTAVMSSHLVMAAVGLFGGVLSSRTEVDGSERLDSSSEAEAAGDRRPVRGVGKKQ